jgi:hypothetical protein
MRRLILIALAGVAALAVGCGGEAAAPPAAPGSPENPVRAQPQERGGEGEPASQSRTSQPGYQALVDGQTSKPPERFTPCNLVTSAQARAIFGVSIRQPLEAPQGPTCIYQTRKGDGFVTVAVQAVDFASVKRQMAQRRQIEISDRTAYCGTHGQPMLVLPLAGDRVLSIAGRCSLARQFAAKAVPRLGA